MINKISSRSFSTAMYERNTEIYDEVLAGEGLPRMFIRHHKQLGSTRKILGTSGVRYYNFHNDTILIQ